MLSFILHLLFAPQHLSTFIMDKTEAILTAGDAIKKLALLDSKGKIWTQEMLLQVTEKAVRLLDCDTQVRPHISAHICSINMSTSKEACQFDDEPSILLIWHNDLRDCDHEI